MKAAVSLFLSYLLLSTSSLMGGIVFDFEDLDPTYLGSGARMGDLTTLTYTLDELGLTISRPSGENDIAFDLTLNEGTQSDKAVEFGDISLDSFVDTTAAAFLVSFSQPVYTVSVDIGDYGDDEDTIVLMAYDNLDGTGTPIATDELILTGVASDFSFLTLSVEDPNISIESVRIVGGSPEFPQSVFVDNLIVEIPEPATAALALALLTGLVAIRRRR